MTFGYFETLVMKPRKNLSTASNFDASTDNYLRISPDKNMFTRYIHCFYRRIQFSRTFCKRFKFFFQVSASVLKGLTYRDPRIILTVARVSSNVVNISSTSSRMNA